MPRTRSRGALNGVNFQVSGSQPKNVRSAAPTNAHSLKIFFCVGGTRSTTAASKPKPTKHANASHASVGLARSNGHLTITISDDGRGIEPAATSATHGGLANIRDRVAALRGTVRVTRATPSGEGTTVLVDLPVGDRDG